MQTDQHGLVALADLSWGERAAVVDEFVTGRQHRHAGREERPTGGGR